MKISDICKRTGLTKKAVEYYQAKKLVSPGMNEHGYRSFSKNDYERLQEIALLRKFDLSVDEIKEVLEGKHKKESLRKIEQKRKQELQVKTDRLVLLGKYIDGEDRIFLEKELQQLEAASTIKEKLLRMFPGYYGRYLCLHFGHFLEEPIKTKEQEAAYQNIIAFLDQMDSFEVADSIKPILDQMDDEISDAALEQFHDNYQGSLNHAYGDFESYWNANKDVIKNYIDFKESKEYKESGIQTLMDIMRDFCTGSGYYEVLLPEMRILSPSYKHYNERLLELNDKLLEKIPSPNHPFTNT